MTAKKRNFVSPIETGNIEFIRPSKLEKPGILLEATFVESLPNAFDNNKLDYKFSADKGKTIILNGAGNLGYQMETIHLWYALLTFLLYKDCLLSLYQRSDK